MTSGLIAPGRSMPENIEAEQMLLGAILVHADAFAHTLPIVRAEQFAEELHRRTFDVMGQLVSEGRPITINGLVAFLGDHELAPGVSTKAYLARLCAQATTVVLAPEYARIVRDMAFLRALISEARALEAKALDAQVDAPPERVAADALEKIRILLEHSPRQSRASLGRAAANLVDRVESIRRGEIRRTGFKTGIADLDRALGGLHPETLVIVAGRVAMGKTVLMTTIAEGVASHNQTTGVLEFSLEVPVAEFSARHLAATAYDRVDPITYSDIISARLNDRQVERLDLARRELDKLPIVIESPPRLTLAELGSRVGVEKKAMAAKGITLGVVLIDYLDKITASDRYAGQRTYEVQEIVTALKAVARSEEVCIVLLAQLNRATEGREDKRPSLADLKSSGALEQEAHAVIFVYREAYYIRKSAAFREGDEEARKRLDVVSNNVELIIGKNRAGPETTVHLWGDVACSYLAAEAP